MQSPFVIAFTEHKRVIQVIAPIWCLMFPLKHYIGATFTSWCSPFARC
ncbi:transporter [Escherichia coli]|nr:transporter [Escherichia coli]NYY76496.1 transporter [Escherichia coli]NYY77690.1 transporter [Escherichia coli]NYY79162.1 transporter [Escherichia coli]